MLCFRSAVHVKALCKVQCDRKHLPSYILIFWSIVGLERCHSVLKVNHAQENDRAGQLKLCDKTACEIYCVCRKRPMLAIREVLWENTRVKVSKSVGRFYKN